MTCWRQEVSGSGQVDADRSLLPCRPCPQNQKHLLVGLAEDESVLRISCPDQLDAQQADLSWESRLELRQLQARLADGQVGLPDDGMEGPPHSRQQLSQPHLHVPLPETDSSATAEAEGVKTHENYMKIHKNLTKSQTHFTSSSSGHQPWKPPGNISLKT